jgi:hypothetical protein
MPTFIYSKEDFIKYIEKQVKDNQVIVFTNELTGKATYSKKTGIKLTHQYSEQAFKDEGLGHIAFGKSHPLGLIVADKSRLTTTAIDALNNTKEPR